jgi:AraC-like DNA-binding protein
MKPLLRKFSIQTDYSFSWQHYSAPHFYNHWHFHPELELLYIVNGTGTRLVGDSVAAFCAGELVLVGANLPHLWRSDDHCENSESVVIHILENFAGKDFLQIPEMKSIKDLFQKAQCGLVFEGKTVGMVSKILLGMQHKTGVERVIDLLTILKTISECSEIYALSKFGFNAQNSHSDTERINKIYAYVLSNFSENITVEQMARLANLSTTSFCRYFKKCTNKTFLDFLIEVRIGHARKQLIETDKSVGQISLEVGYNSISNFNSYFKKTTNMTPLAYQKAYKS